MTLTLIQHRSLIGSRSEGEVRVRQGWGGGRRRWDYRGIKWARTGVGIMEWEISILGEEAGWYGREIISKGEEEGKGETGREGGRRD